MLQNTFWSSFKDHTTLRQKIKNTNKPVSGSLKLNNLQFLKSDLSDINPRMDFVSATPFLLRACNHTHLIKNMDTLSNYGSHQKTPGRAVMMTCLVQI